MKKVLIVALSALALAGSAWAQEVPGVVPPVPPDPPAQLAQAAPAAPAPRPAQAAPAAPAPPPAPARPAQPRPAAPAAAPAQVPPPPPQPAPRSTPNVRFEVTITDTGGAKPVTKTLSLTIGSFNNSASIRNVALVPNNSGVTGPAQLSIPLNVDVRAVTWLDNNAVRANVTVEYQPYMPDAKSQPGTIQASAQTVFYDGRRTQILMAADPVSDRKTTIDVTATILK
jgi:hypothetical protein